MSLLGLVPFLKIAIMKSESTGNIIATMSPNVEIMISALRRRCVDKTVALLGSAPGKWDISDRPDIISGVNSSHINFGLKEVDILFFNIHISITFFLNFFVLTLYLFRYFFS